MFQPDGQQPEKNKLTAAEKLGISRSDWIGLDRQVSVCLHRLRLVHTYLNTSNHRIDKDVDPSCRKGCEALETANHIMLECPAFEVQRREIRV